MTTFDPETGVLRVRHGALAVLAVLATDPASPRLHDHAVAEPLAELRGAGLLGPGGLDPSVAPLAHAIGAARVTADLVADDHGTVHRARVWIGSETRPGASGPTTGGSNELAVVGLASPDDPETYQLMADAVAHAPALLAELVGLGVVVAPPVDGARAIDASDFAAFVAADEQVHYEAVVKAAGDDAFAHALADGLKGAGLRWRLTVDQGPELWVLDAGRSGLWVARREPDTAELTVRAVTADQARADLGAALA